MTNFNHKNRQTPILSKFADFNLTAEGRNRTDMGLLPPDFESGAYTNFATPARNMNDKTNRPPASTNPKRFTCKNNNCKILISCAKLNVLFYLKQSFRKFQSVNLHK